MKESPMNEFGDSKKIKSYQQIPIWPKISIDIMYYLEIDGLLSEADNTFSQPSGLRKRRSYASLNNKIEASICLVHHR